VRKTAVYALGGNALQSPGDERSTASEVLARVMSDVIDLLEMDWSVVITHGNGPQVGHLLAMDEHQTQGLDSWVAATQGMIGHELSMHLQAILERRRRPERTAVLLTRVEVDKNDEAFAWPTKPVGPVLSSQTVMTADWDIAETVHGPRRVVASPLPIRIMELDVIEQLVQLNAVVICGGGGGVPTARLDQHLQGMPAVVDKDHFSSLLARDLGAHALIISTEADAIYRNFGTEDAQAMRRLMVDDARALGEAGEFPKGSMGPKVEALCQFAEQSETNAAILCSPGDVLLALRGERGTTITST
tara:strand:+ start:4604 stop:5512 length:909 start_codon:yes stop_codon:yes gene_type:complete